MKPYDWSSEKNDALAAERGVSFADIMLAIQDGRWLATVNHPNQKKYPGQRMMVIDIEQYAYLVPFVEDSEKYFLKTIIPSRKMTKEYIINKKEPR